MLDTNKCYLFTWMDRYAEILEKNVSFLIVRIEFFRSENKVSNIPLWLKSNIGKFSACDRQFFQFHLFQHLLA